MSRSRSHRTEAVGIDGRRVRDRRAALGLTQTELAERSGLSQEAVSRIENGRIKGLMQPTQDALAHALNTTVEWLRGERGAVEDRASVAARAGAGEGAGAPETQPDDDPLVRAVSAAFDPKRSHLLTDANRVLETLRTTDRRLIVDQDLMHTARQWLDAAAGLRRDGVGVSAENLLLRLTAGRGVGADERLAGRTAEANAEGDARARAAGVEPGSGRAALEGRGRRGR